MYELDHLFKLLVKEKDSNLFNNENVVLFRFIEAICLLNLASSNSLLKQYSISILKSMDHVLNNIDKKLLSFLQIQELNKPVLNEQITDLLFILSVKQSDGKESPDRSRDMMRQAVDLISFTELLSDEKNLCSNIEIYESEIKAYMFNETT
jgi:hypothetical protein